MEYAVSNVNQIARVLQLTIGGKIIYGLTLHILNITNLKCGRLIFLLLFWGNHKQTR